MNAYEREKLFKNTPFYRSIGIDLKYMKNGKAEIVLPFDRKLTHEYGLIQGGVIVTLADAACAAALLSLLENNEEIVTISLSVNFIRSVNEDLTAEAEIIHKGGTTAVAECAVYSKSGKLTAKVTDTFMIIKNSALRNFPEIK